jgi:mono/diheme cytochrome c family protein
MHVRQIVYSVGVSAGLLAAGASMRAAAQTGGPPARPTPPSSLMIPSVSGRDLYGFYCATCHGREAKGDGPAASALKTPPPDLTMIAARRGGVFPAKTVESTILGDQDASMPAHGTREMPMWGPIFRALNPNDTMTKVRVENLVSYLRSLQR